MLSERGHGTVALYVSSRVLFDWTWFPLIWFNELTPVERQSDCVGELVAKEITLRHENIHFLPSCVSYDKVFIVWFKLKTIYIYIHLYECMLQIFALACSADQILLCEMFRENIFRTNCDAFIQPWASAQFPAVFVWFFYYYCYYYSFHEIVPHSPYWWQVYLNKVVEIYIYVFTKGLPSNY